MPVEWMDVSDLSLNSILLLERYQLSLFPGWVQENALAISLQASPHIEWFMRRKCPELNDWLDNIISNFPLPEQFSYESIREAEVKVLKTINDLLVYVLDPEIYEAQPFLQWDPSELTSMADFSNKVVLDVGSGTGRLACIAAETAKVVYAVEPVANLRQYLKEKSRQLGFGNIFSVDGLITDIPFEDNFADVCMGGHVFGDHPEEECNELFRVTKKNGWILLCPGNIDEDNEAHKMLISRGFQWSRFEEPGAGVVRKYWIKT